MTPDWPALGLPYGASGWVPMMTNLADPAAPHAIAKEVRHRFPSDIDHKQKMHILFTPK